MGGSKTTKILLIKYAMLAGTLVYFGKMRSKAL